MADYYSYYAGGSPPSGVAVHQDSPNPSSDPDSISGGSSPTTVHDHGHSVHHLPPSTQLPLWFRQSSSRSLVQPDEAELVYPTDDASTESTIGGQSISGDPYHQHQVHHHQHHQLHQLIAFPRLDREHPRLHNSMPGYFQQQLANLTPSPPLTEPTSTSPISPSVMVAQTPSTALGSAFQWPPSLSGHSAPSSSSSNENPASPVLPLPSPSIPRRRMDSDTEKLPIPSSSKSGAAPSTPSSSKDKEAGGIKREASGSGSARERKHACKMCTKRFDRPSTLKKHLLVHTGEKAFQCGTCGRRFGVASNLNRHVRKCSTGVLITPSRRNSRASVSASSRSSQEGEGRELEHHGAGRIARRRIGTVEAASVVNGIVTVANGASASPAATMPASTAPPSSGDTTLSSSSSGSDTDPTPQAIVNAVPTTIAPSANPTTPPPSAASAPFNLNISPNSSISSTTPPPHPAAHLTSPNPSPTSATTPQTPAAARQRRRRAAAPLSPWIPVSLRRFDFSATLQIVSSLPLSPVRPDPYGTGEERDSFDDTVGERPYHPDEWRWKPRLPGPAVISGFLGQGMTVFGLGGGHGYGGWGSGGWSGGMGGGMSFDGAGAGGGGFGSVMVF